MQRIVAGLGWIALLALPDLAKAKPDAVPVFDVAPSCAEARAYAGSDKDLAYQGCMKDEREARAELARKWAHFEPADRRDCVAQGAAPVPSYVEILTCLEMSEEANALYNPDGTARVKPLRPAEGLPGPNLAAPSDNSLTPPSPPASNAVPSGEGNPPAPASPYGSEAVPNPEGIPPVPALPPGSDVPTPEGNPPPPSGGQ